MEAIKKQASKLRDQVARQQQAVFRQFTMRFGHDPGLVDEAELHYHHNLQKLYTSTKAAKQLQRNIVRGIESFISISSKQMEIVKRLAEDCCKYGNANQSFEFPLARASLEFGTSHNLIEKERENLLRVLGDQVFEPLKDMIMSAPLEDARLLTYRYERIRQDVESQIAEVVKRQLKSKENGSNPDSFAKLRNAETKLTELQNTLSALGTEATAAMLAVEADQQNVTFDRLLAMVDSERAYHQSVGNILDNLHDQMIMAKEQSESLALSLSQRGAAESNLHLESIEEEQENNKSSINKSVEGSRNGQSDSNFIAEVIHAFDAQADGELSLSVGDCVVVHQVGQNGWSEGECEGKTGWFPTAYVQRTEIEITPVSKLTEPPALLTATT